MHSLREGVNLRPLSSPSKSWKHATLNPLYVVPLLPGHFSSGVLTSTLPVDVVIACDLTFLACDPAETVVVVMAGVFAAEHDDAYAVTWL